MKKKSVVCKKFNGRCAYCGTKKPYFRLTIDHLMPRKLGGGHEINNLVPACLTCNQAKGHKTLDHFRGIIANVDTYKGPYNVQLKKLFSGRKKLFMDSELIPLAWRPAGEPFKKEV